jgi:hypothetical protein
MTPTQLLLTFADEETADYVKLVCRRKGISLESYIVDNLEWDNKPDCLYPDVLTKIPKGVCHECEFNETCPDAFKKEPMWAKRGIASRIIPRG